MAADELNSFMFKFKNLWRNGQEATLNVRSKAGNAWVELSVGLGHPLDLPPPPLYNNYHQGNSRDRRRNRRKAEKINQKLKETEEVLENETEEVLKNKTEEVLANETDEVLENKTHFEKEHAEVHDDKDNLTSTSKEGENTAENPVTNGKDFIEPCETCKQVFAYNKDLNYNMCDECLTSISEKELIDLPDRYQCEICKLKFKTKTLFKEHKQCFNFGIHSLAFICVTCDRIWKDEEQFENHMKQKHIKHTCVRCNHKVEGKDNLDKHFKAKHRAF